MTTIVTSDRSFSSDQRQCLELLSDLMIPASGEMPGAGDSAIFVRTEAALVQHREAVIDAVNELESLTLSQEAARKSFADLDDESRLQVVAAFRESNPAFISILQSCVVASYYQDDRVLRGIGLPDRAPFPVGHAVDETDWSLLDPVRERPPFYRLVDEEGE